MLGVREDQTFTSAGSPIQVRVKKIKSKQTNKKHKDNQIHTYTHTRNSKNSDDKNRILWRRGKEGALFPVHQWNTEYSLVST